MKPGPQSLKPSRADVERILAEEAKRARCKVDHLLAPGRPRQRVLKAKRQAIRRIVEETGCSGRGLAKVWGLSPCTVRTAMGPTPPSNIYTPPTIARLIWQKGIERTRQIIAGKDEATNADVEAWRRLSDRSAA